MRYCVMAVPWDFSYLTGAESEDAEGTPEKPKTPMEQEIAARRKRFEGSEEAEADPHGIENELEEANESYGS